MRFERLRESDIAEALELSTQAGWNQTEADWHRLLDLNPAGAYGLCRAGRLVATATRVSYDATDAATHRASRSGNDGASHGGVPDRSSDRSSGRRLDWIGMVLVDGAHRGQGFGSAILRHALDASQTGADAPVGLDATELGEPLYRRLGFVAVGAVDRWSGSLRSPASPSAARPLLAEHLDEIVALDRRACEIDRGELIRHLVAETGVRGWVTFARETGRGGLSGFALLRPGRTRYHLGPVIAGSEADFAALVHAASETLAGEPVVMDAVRTPPTSATLLESGVRIERRLTRMTYPGARRVLSGPWVRLITAFEWG